MLNNKIIIKNAKENNLKGINLEIPKNKLVVITGVSGSGKSSLAFDVIYNEGRRRYVDSLSSYARQFLGGTSKPDVESITGLTPAIAVDQKTTSNNPRSTVGTTTEIHDHFRLLFARIGIAYCPIHNIKIEEQTITQITNKVFKDNEGSDVVIMAPVISEQKGSHEKELDRLKTAGFIRVRINGKIIRLDENIELEKNKKHSISIVVDRVKISPDTKERVYEALEVGSTYSEGTLIVHNQSTNIETMYSRNYSCKHGDFDMVKIEPRLFSFNSHTGACKGCNGIGYMRKATWDTVTDEEKSVMDGGVLTYPVHKVDSRDFDNFRVLMKFYNMDPTIPMKEWTKKQKNIFINGALEKDKKHFTYSPTAGEGMGSRVERRYEGTSSIEAARRKYEKLLTNTICSICNGNRLNRMASSVRISENTLPQINNMSITNILKWLDDIKLTQTQTQISEMVTAEIKNRLLFLENLGLGYLNLNRQSSTLSGGESQRIKLASQLGSKLSGIIYVLDEPSIGLHQRDNSKLIKSLKEMRDLGNTIIIVEHDEETMLEADFIIDIGPDAGEKGGVISSIGTPNEISKNATHTGRFLSGKDVVCLPSKRRNSKPTKLTIKGAKANNLKNISVDIPLGVITAITGVSGSGKSTLINEVLYKGLSKKLNLPFDGTPGEHKTIENFKEVDKIIRISQSPIGRTPRSNPATYTSVMDDIRDIFSKTEQSQIKGYDKGRFSFNVSGGRCEKCRGDGVLKVSMNFMPDVQVICDECSGKRYNENTLQIKYKDKNIANILEMEIQEAYMFFNNIPKIKKKLELLIDVGLGYMKLGHPSTLLSGGEAQRVKIATHLQKKPTGRTLFIMDEPTTGLHNHDIIQLSKVLNRIVENGDTIIVIEHNLDIIKTADWVIDMGPEGGEAGGSIVGKGTPEELIRNKKSITGHYLKPYLKKNLLK